MTGPQQPQQAPYPQQPPYPPQQPGYPPQGYPHPGQWSGQPAAGAPGQALIWVLALVSLVGVVLGLSLDENGRNAWDSVNAWGGLAIAGSVLSAAGAFGPMFGLNRARAAQLALLGAGALGLFWVLLVLPGVGSNTSLLTTIGVIAGVAAAWKSQQPQSDGPAAGSSTW